MVENIEADLAPRSVGNGVIVVDAHYDSARLAGGANDNGSGVAAALEIARLLRDQRLEKAVRFVFFTNEEEPYFDEESKRHGLMGSKRYADELAQCGAAGTCPGKIDVMFSLETLGYYTREPASQCLYPGFLEFDGLADSRPCHATLRPGETRARVHCVVQASPYLGFDFDRGDFLAFVGNLASRSWVRDATYAFGRAEPCVPAVGIATPGRLPWARRPRA